MEYYQKEKEEKLNFLAKWSRFFISKYKITIIFLIAMILMGFWATDQNQRQDFPPVPLNFVFVSVVYPGAGPEAIATEVLGPIEDTVNNHEQTVRIRSTAYPNYGISWVEIKSFNESVINETIKEFKEQIDALSLPENVDTRVFTEDAMSVSMAYVLSSDTESLDDVLSAAPKLKEYIQNSSDEIKNIDLAPSSDFDVRIELDAVKMIQKGMDVQTVKGAVGANLSLLPGGSIVDEETGITNQINIENPSTSVDDIKNIVLSAGVKLSDIAEVKRQASDFDALTMAGYIENGEPKFNDEVVYLMVGKTDDGDIIQLKNDVEVALEDVYEKGILDESMSINLVMDSAISVESQINSLLKNGLIGLIAILIVFMFFIDIRIGLVVGLIIPFTFLITLFVLNQIGYSLNTLTLFAMILTLGILVDNAIVIAEGIVHRIQKYGETKAKAAVLAIRDLGPAVTAATLTTIVVFIPAANMGGIMGEIMKYIPYTIIIMMIVSYFLAISITPLLGKWILKQETEEERANRKLRPWQKMLIIPIIVLYGQRMIDSVVSGYGKLMEKVHRKWSLKIAILVILVAALGGSLAIAGSGKIPGSQFPITDTWSFTVSVNYPAGTPTDVRREIMSDIVKEGIEVPYFEGSYIFDNTNMVLITEPGARSDDKETTVYTIVEDIDDELQYVRDKAPEGTYISVNAISYGPSGTMYDVILEIKNSDAGILESAVDDVDKFVRGKSEAGEYEIKRISNDITDKLVPSVDISFDKDKVRQLGITPLTTSMIVNSVFSESDISKIVVREDGVQDDVVLTFSEESTNSVEKLEKLLIPTAVGGVVTLDQIATVSKVEEAESIDFIDGERTIMYQIDLDVAEDDRSGVAGKLETDIKEYLSAEKLESLGLESDGVGYGGFASEIEGDMSSLMNVFIIALIAVYLILVFQFNSYIQPALILMAIPMALIGVFPGLLLVGSSIDMISGLGIIALVGIVVNDAIVFVDYFNRQRKKNPDWSIAEALVYTGKVRFKPIFSTSITTIAGVLPLTMADPFWTGLGTAIIGGLIFSTIGNLVVLPILIYITDRVKKPFVRLFTRKKQPA
ncbi:efflux RND transporter permease subunit [Patescibacteria group bacterium]|nr:efflux RND transporter permease subunit [Patescibacteria group bacterium]MBU1951950.1 efflux RND transporter permease subunit [Patescibacteria group bacterium]